MDTQTKITMAAIKAALRARKVPALVGEPGTGKTETIRAMAEDMGYELITLLGSTMDPTDVAGFPHGEVVMVDDDGNPINGTVYLPPVWQVQALQKKKVIIFLDEYSNAPASVRAAFLTIIQNREFPSGARMPKETLMIMAMNPPEQAADGYEMDMPTSNRLMWISWDPSLQAWLEGMRTAWGKDVDQAELRWKNLIASFIEDQPRLLHKMPGNVGGREGGKTNSPEAFGVNSRNQSAMMCFRSAWPSRRSWDNLSQVLAHCSRDAAEQDAVAEGLVGNEATGAFRAWLKAHESDLKYTAVLKDPQAVDWKAVAPDSAHTVLRTIVQKVDATNCEAAIGVFKVIAEAGRADLGAPFIQDLIQAISDAKRVPSPVQRKKNTALMHEVFPLYMAISANSQ